MNIPATINDNAIKVQITIKQFRIFSLFLAGI
uniref:Uncharacterized protein n=1 Tax=Siphoviridae sp. ctorp6 TaxID=2825673 RepID=A0A8S5PEL5_9CAUD|nr:MAG TPA: hypothetical protein [Siphoviridae sp. ctorp6]